MSQTKIGVLLVVACTLLEGIGQVFLKKSVLRAVRSYLWISFGIVILALEAALYTKALLFLDVGAAYSISSLSLISVTFMSQCLLRERVTRTRWIGVCLIFIGAARLRLRISGSSSRIKRTLRGAWTLWTRRLSVVAKGSARGQFDVGCTAGVSQSRAWKGVLILQILLEFGRLLDSRL
jgi:drug/metabolite transporter (DMT)-like permease